MQAVKSAPIGIGNPYKAVTVNLHTVYRTIGISARGLNTRRKSENEIYNNNNKLSRAKYEVSSRMKKSLKDLFFYTGYVQNKYAVPNVTSRAWFNFIQCDPVIKLLNPNVNDDLLDELKDKFRNGVTFFHMNTISGVKTWDLAQEKENWETSLL